MSEETGAREDANGVEARYANYFEVGHNALEVLLDFGQFYPGAGRPRVHTRVITSPTYAKALSTTILESLARYEEAFGEIPRMDNESELS